MEYISYTSIKSWAEEDRPREKLIEKGSKSLSNSELIAILLVSGYAGKSAVEVARALLDKTDNDLRALSKLSHAELINLGIKGIGEVKALSIISAFELGRRRSILRIPDLPKISSSKDVADIFQAKLSHLDHEEFWVMFMNRANKVVALECMSIGGLSGTVADLRRIFNRALSLLCCAIIVSHNHPSGNTKPSQADISLTKKLHKAGIFLEIPLLDHVIIAGDHYFSFSDEGIL